MSNNNHNGCDSIILINNQNALLSYLDDVESKTKYSKNGLKLKLNQDDPIGLSEYNNTSIYLTEECFMFFLDDEGYGYKVDYRLIGLHAITNNNKCLYLQINQLLPLNQINLNKDKLKFDKLLVNNNQDLDLNAKTSELWFQYDNTDDLSSSIIIHNMFCHLVNQAYETLNHCQEMNPDNSDSNSDIEDDYTLDDYTVLNKYNKQDKARFEDLEE